MKHFWLLLICGLAFCPNAFAGSCESLLELKVPHGKVTMAAMEPAGTLTGLTKEPLEDLPSFCRVAATPMPTSDSNIRIEVWMPIAGWNGKYEGTGNGGYAGVIGYGSLAAGLRRGYAVANTDMGTYPSVGEDSEALIGHPEKWEDWGSRSTHEMTVAAKQIVQAFYGKEAQRSYYVGCSTGGQRGLVEAQRFPDDYDGVIAGAPANNRTRLHMGFIWDLAVADTAGSYIPASKLAVMTDAMFNACSSEKAVASDKFLTNPAACHWDPGVLECKSADAPDCLTTEQVATARKLYEGPTNPVTHAAIYPGLTRGSEFDWDSMIPRGGAPRYDALFKWTFGARWDWRTFDFNRDVTAVDALLGAKVNATDPNLGTFKAHGHKLIVYHGWADVIVPSLESINYYASVESAQAQSHRGTGEEMRDFYRLFMVPGMAHCGGGPGLNSIDAVESLELWVEKGIAPERIVAKRTEKGVTVMTRPVCAYPLVAHYKGSGDANDAGNFACGKATE